MTEIRFHSSDPSRRPRTFSVTRRWGIAVAVLLLAAGISTAVGLLAAPGFVAEISRSADRLVLRQAAQRGVEAFDSVRRRQGEVALRVDAAELLLLRLAVMTGAEIPAGFPDASGPANPPRTPDELEYEVLHLQRRLKRLETVRRSVASVPASAVDPARVPSRSPVEPASAVPVAVFGPRVSPITHHPEFFAGLELAVPAGEAVIAPAAGTVVFAGTVPPRTGGAWRSLGNVVVLAHGSSLSTLYGHLARPVVRRGQKVSRGDLLARAGETGLAPATRLHYQLFRQSVPVDPRLYILDAAWIAPDEARELRQAPAGLELPSVLR